MTSTPQRGDRRSDALNRDRIVEAAIGILDSEGNGALTFRALAAALATGSGALYHHVANKDELLTAAADRVIASALVRATTDSHAAPDADATDPRQEIRAVSVAVFDSIDDHPWVGTQLMIAPGQSAMARIIDSVGSRVRALGVSEATLFDTVFTLVNYILGVAVQNAANARMHAGLADRSAILEGIAAGWADLDDAQFPFLSRIAAQLPDHDDREQFLFGVDLFLSGTRTDR